jgi:acetyl esterase
MNPRYAARNLVCSILTTRSARTAGLALLTSLPFFALAADPAPLAPEQLQRVLRRYPEADADKDGKLTAEEARAFLRKMRTGNTTKAGSDPAATATNLPPTKPNSPRADAPLPKRARLGDTTAELKPDHSDVSYGPYPNNKLDLWLAKSDRPVPLVVFIHGGGFKAGDKSSASPRAIQECLAAGVSFASINYRFRTELPIQDVLRDSARAIQFLRWKAMDYNLDKTRVAAFGGSAGAGTSLWLAFHPDLADAQSPDPVLRESSRLAAAASSAGQATYDILKWRDVLGADEAMRFYPESTWPGFYGLKTLDDLQSERGQKLRADVDMLGLITPDDPPVWLGASDRHDTLANKGDTNHSPKHSEAIKKRCDEVGVPCVLKVGNLTPAGDESGHTSIGFLLKSLQAKPRASN